MNKKTDMAITERIAYVKGLADGLELKAQSKEGRVLYAILDILQEMGDAQAENEMMLNSIAHIIDDMQDEVIDLQETLGIDYDEDDEDFDDYEDEDDMLELECPECGEIALLPEGRLLLPDSLKCPACGNRMVPSED